MDTKKLPYRIDRLPVIMPFHRRAENQISEGELVYYGPSPEFYGVGEVIQVVENLCLVDFRGTGECGIQKDVLNRRYLIPIHKLKLDHLLTDR